MGSESAKIVSAMYVRRDPARMALVATGLVEVGSPDTVTKALVYRPDRDHQTATLQSHALLGAVSFHPISGRLDRQSQDRPYRRQVQPFVVRCHSFPLSINIGLVFRKSNARKSAHIVQ